MLASCAALGCQRGAPPGDQRAVETPAITTTEVKVDLPRNAALPLQPSAAAPQASLDAGASDAAQEAASRDESRLPQTTDRPSAEPDSALLAQGEALITAIASATPTLADPGFFPVAAYEQVKAIPQPARDWQHRLLGAFHRDILKLHATLGTSARFVRWEIPNAARWIKPREEGNLLGYFRVYGAHIVAACEGREQRVPVTSLISWRGHWYVVHLSGFR